MENQRGLEKMRFSENEKSELLFLIKSICSLEKKKEKNGKSPIYFRRLAA